MNASSENKPTTHKRAHEYEALAFQYLSRCLWLPYIIRIGAIFLVDVGFTLYYRTTGVYNDPEGKVDSLIKTYHDHKFSSESGKFFGENQNIQPERIAIVTGGNVGIGLETAWALTRAGFYVIIACRDECRATEAIKKIFFREPSAKIQFLKLDLSQLDSVKQFVKKFQSKFNRLDVLINNAGIMNLPKYEETVDKFEKQYQVNYLGHFLLIRLLLETLAKTPRSKVISVSSIASYAAGACDFSQAEVGEKSYDPLMNYSLAKIALIMMTYSLQEKMVSQDVQFYVVHPGLVSTPLLHSLVIAQVIHLGNTKLFKTPLEGAMNALILALTPNNKLKSISHENARYFADELPMEPYIVAEDIEKREDLWVRTCKLLKLPEVILNLSI